VRTILDLGCGTGNHSVPLSRRGYEVVGVERSDDMLALARRRLGDNGGAGALTFEQGDIRRIDFGRTFDVALMMFAVLGYQVENRDVVDALKAARRHLQPGGLFLFDVWYGPAVLRQRPSERIKVIPGETGDILRAASGELNSGRHTCAVRYRVWQFSGDRVVASTDETHLMRFFFPQELSLILEGCGLSLVRLGAFPNVDEDPDEATWNVMAVARAV
jgi:SAM-dependent methyltransferase